MRAHAIGRLLLGLALLTSLLPLHAQETKPDAGDKLIQALFESEDEEDLTAAVAAARTSGVPNQAILEARFLFLVDQQDFAAVAALAPVLELQKVIFRIEDSVIFSVPEEFYAIIEFCQALGALHKEDHAAFKRHITEAFWLSPRQAAAFAPHIERLRQKEAMAGLKIDLNGKFKTQSDGKEVSLTSLARKSKFLVVHFWSPWSTECEANLPDFVAMAAELDRNKLPVVSVLIEPGADALKAAKDFRAGFDAKTPGDWIVDNSKTSLARTLRVQELPSIALLNLEGAVLFSGHPSEDGLWTALQKVNPKIMRPRLEAPE